MKYNFELITANLHMHTHIVH